MFQGMEYIYEVYKEKSFSKAAAALFPSRHDPSGLRRAVCRIRSGRPAAGFLQPGDPLQQDPALPAEHHLQGTGHCSGRGRRCAGGGLPHRQHRCRCRSHRPDHLAGGAGKRQQPVQRHRHPAGQTLLGGRLDHCGRCGR